MVIEEQAQNIHPSSNPDPRFNPIMMLRQRLDAGSSTPVETRDYLIVKKLSYLCCSKLNAILTDVLDCSVSPISYRVLRHQEKILSMNRIIVCSSILLLIGLVCLCQCNSAPKFKSQFSSLATVNPQQAKQQPTMSNGKPLIAQQQNPIALKMHQHQLASKSSLQVNDMRDMGHPGNLHVSNDELRPMRSNQRQQVSSIDRFDSGEQIRPPSLVQATTLAPVMYSAPNKMTSPQIATTNAYNMQASASQDSYLSPEDREQLLKSQESHYEGKSAINENSQSGTAPAGSIGRSNSIWRTNDLVPQVESSLSKEQIMDYPAAGTTASSKTISSDRDYEYESVETPKHQQKSVVPENRRSSHNHKNHRLYRPDDERDFQANPSDESNSSDDYNSASNNEANDDTYFSRKASNQDQSQIKSKTSHDTSGKTYGHSGEKTGPKPKRYEVDNWSGNTNQGESPGFGPGPNEAYMVDKAESGNKGVALDNDDESGSPGHASEANLFEPNDQDSESDEEHSKIVDRRSMHDKSSDSRSKSSPSVEANSVNSHQMVNDDTDTDPDDVQDSSEEPVPASVPSPQTEFKSSRELLNHKMNNAGPKTAASAITTRSTLEPTLRDQEKSVLLSHGSLVARSPPLVVSASALLPTNKPHLTKNNQQQHHRQPIVNNVPVNLFNTLNKQQVNVPYNPQNNPSHIGKYFIN